MPTYNWFTDFDYKYPGKLKCTGRNGVFDAKPYIKGFISALLVFQEKENTMPTQKPLSPKKREQIVSKMAQIIEENEERIRSKKPSERIEEIENSNNGGYINAIIMYLDEAQKEEEA